MLKPLSIIGLDPGTTSAYAVLDLEGNLLETHSSKELPLSQIISQTIKISQPLVAATDKEKVPSLIQEFSAKLGTILIIPEQDLKKQEKKELTGPYGIQNMHQLDSLAAALFAYKKLKPTLIKIDNFIKKNDLENLRNSFTQLILKKNFNFELAKKNLTQSKEDNKEYKSFRPVFEEEKITKTDFLKLFERLDKTKTEEYYLKNEIKRLKENISHLKQTNLFLAKKLNKTNLRIDTLLNFKEKRIKDLSQELNKKEKENEFLLKEIEELKELFFNLENKMIIRKVKDLGNNFKKKDFEIKGGGYLFVENPFIISSAVWEELKEKGINLFSKINRKGIFVLENFLDKDDFIIADKTAVEKAMVKRDILSEVIDEYKQSRKIS